MSVEKIISDFKEHKFKSFYWLEGEEPFFIDQVMQYAEHHILTEAEASFNLSVFYGRDAHWVDVMNTCRKYPMFAERQVVMLKEAQHMKDLDKLEPYFENPLKTTVFIVSYKDKKVDGRSKLCKTLKTKGELVTTKKLFDNQLPDWSNKLIQQYGLTINQKALFLLIDHIGNDLSRIKNEIEKMAVNLNGRKNISEEDIETYIGISKEFNVFELQDALGKKNTPKAIRILQYFESNPKAAPVPMMLPSLYNFFSKVYMIFGTDSKDERSLAASIGVNPYYIKDYLQSSKNYGQSGIEKILLLLHQYNLRSLGVNNSNTSDAGLMKELVIKMIA